MNNIKDDYIRKKLQEDKFVSKRVNDIFEDFKQENNNKLSEEIVDNKSYNVEKQDTLYYKKINKILSIAAVFLCIVLVGMGTLLYNRPSQIENIDIVTKSVIVKNQEIKFNKEEVLKYYENDSVIVSLLGDREVAIQLKDEFINCYGLNLNPDKKYEVSNINKKVKDVFVGYMVSKEFPYVLLIMEDGTAECVQILYDRIAPSRNYEFNFYSQGTIEGLYDVVAFMQESKYFTNSNDVYYYINAIRKDGRTKAIELGYYNDWNDDNDELYDMLNDKYIKGKNNQDNSTVEDNQKNNNNATEKNQSNNTINNNQSSNSGIEKDQNTNNATQNNSNTSLANYNNEIVSEFERRVKQSNNYYINSQGHYCLTIENDATSAYHIENSNLFRTNITKGNTVSWIATGVNDLYKDENGKLVCVLQKEYSIVEYDNNIIYSEYDVTQSEVCGVYENQSIKVESKADGSLTIQILKGGLKNLGISANETTLKENVKYNMYGLCDGVFDKKTGNTYANATIGILGEGGKTNRLNFAYARMDNTVICIDIVTAICNNSFKDAKCSTAYGLPSVVGFSIGKMSVEYNSNGEKVPTYDAFFAIVREDGIEYESKITTIYDF